MVEWSITVVLKTTVPRGTGGSNPSLSAKNPRNLLKISRFFFFMQKLLPLIAPPVFLSLFKYLKCYIFDFQQFLS